MSNNRPIDTVIECKKGVIKVKETNIVEMVMGMMIMKILNF
jgi:hypothetical protein